MRGLLNQCSEEMLVKKIEEDVKKIEEIYSYFKFATSHRPMIQGFDLRALKLKCTP